MQDNIVARTIEAAQTGPGTRPAGAGGAIMGDSGSAAASMTDGSASGGAGGGRTLQAALSQIRLADDERRDALIQARDTRRARLELLARELGQIAADLAAESEQFIMASAPGETPRYWVDVTSHVFVGRDAKTCRFVKDTHLGRVTIFETADIGQMADCISAYAAERVLERQRAMEGDWLAYWTYRANHRTGHLAAAPVPGTAPGFGPAPPPARGNLQRRTRRSRPYLALTIGVCIGIALIVLYDRFAPLFMN